MTWLKTLIGTLAAAIVAVSGLSVAFASFNTITYIPIYFAGQNTGVGTSTPWAKFSIYTSTTTDATPQNNPLFLISSSTANSTTTLFKVDRTGLHTQGGRVPTVATSTGYGTGASGINIAGAGNFFNVNFTSGSAPTAAATAVTVTLPSACPTATVPVMSPVGTTTDAAYASSTSASTFDIVSGTTGLISTTTYSWDIYVGCY